MWSYKCVSLCRNVESQNKFNVLYILDPKLKSTTNKNNDQHQPLILTLASHSFGQPYVLSDHHFVCRALAMSVDCFAEKSGQNGSPMKCTISTQCFFLMFFHSDGCPCEQNIHMAGSSTQKNGMMNKDAQAIRIRIRQMASIWNLHLFLAAVRSTYTTWCPTENSYSYFPNSNEKLKKYSSCKQK